MENLNIDQLIQELRSVYDGLKMSKSELNKKIRTLNNAVSRKDRKRKEYNSYENKAVDTKDSLINYTRTAYDDITSSTLKIETIFSSKRREIEEIRQKISILEKSGDLTKSQKAAADLFRQFSNEVIAYFDENIYELKNWKYDSLKQFLREEIKEGEILDAVANDEKVKNDIYTPVVEMLSMAGDWNAIRQDSEKNNTEINKELNDFYGELNTSQEESQIVDKLLAVTQNELSQADVRLQDAVANGSTEEVIAELTKAKDELQMKKDELQKQRDWLSKLVEKLNKLIQEKEQQKSEDNQYYATLIESKYNTIYSIYNNLMNKRGVIISEGYVDFMKSKGTRMDWSIIGDILSKISDYGGFQPMNDLHYWTIGNVNNERNYKGLSFDLNSLSYDNRDLVKGSDWLKGSVMSSEQFQWLNSGSVGLNQNFYAVVIDYLNELKGISENKGRAYRMNLSIDDLRYELSKILDIKDSKLEEMSMLDNEILAVEEKLQNLGSDIDKLYQELNELDSTDINYLDNWQKIRGDISSIQQIQGETVNEHGQLNTKREKVNLYIIIYLDQKISELNDSITSIDDNVRSIYQNIRNQESYVKQLLEALDPENGQLVEAMTDVNGSLYYFNEEFSNVLKNKIKDAVAMNYDEFVNSNFGYLIECLGVHLTDIDYVFPKLYEFIIYFY